MELVTHHQCACANCGAVIDYRSFQAGTVVSCPGCHEESQLPEPDKLVVVEVFGPPLPESRTCPDCNSQIRFIVRSCPICEAAHNKKVRWVWRVSSVSAALLVVLVAVIVRHHFETPPPPKISHYNISASPGPKILMEQPRPRMPKSINDLHPGRFALEQRRGSDLVMAVGDIENNSDNVHTGLRADVDLLDRKGAKIGTVSDYATALGAHQSWHFLTTVTDTNATSLKLVRIVEDP